MSGSYKLLRSLLLLLGVVVHLSQPQTIEQITTNFCEALINEDNFSCNGDAVELGNCFSRDLVCDNVQNCAGNEDEGDTNVLSSLNCDPVNRDLSQLSCGLGATVGIDALCDGVDDCGAAGGNSGIDEDLLICDNKCLLPYYGGCSRTEQCDNSRGGIGCDVCLPGYFRVVGRGFCDPFIDISVVDLVVSIAENSPDLAEVCLQANFRADLSTANSPDPATSTEPNFNINVFGQATFTPVLGGNPQFVVVENSITLNPVTNPEECFAIDITDDLIVESGEEVSVDIEITSSSPLDNQVQAITPLTATIQVIDNDMPIFGFAGSVFSGTEDPNPDDSVVPVIVQISNGIQVNFPVTVTLSAQVLAGNSARATDFTGFAAQSFTFPANSLSAVFDIAITDDNFIEDLEDFSLSLVAVSQGTIDTSSNTATAQITSDDVPFLVFDPLAYSLGEGLDGTAFIQIDNNVLFDPLDGGSVVRTVRVDTATAATGNPAISGTDFTAIVNRIVTFSSSTFSTPFSILEDDINEQNEMFLLQITPGGSFAVPVVDNEDVATVTILDNDLISLAFDPGNGPASENENNVEVCVNLVSGILSTPLDVELTLGSISATVGDDFGVNTDPIGITFPANSQPPQQVCIFVPIQNDDLVEGPELFTVTAQPASLFPSGNTNIITIEDNDMALFRFAALTQTLLESIGQAAFAIELAPTSGELTDPVTVGVAITGGSASAFGVNADFSAPLCQLVFGPGSGPLDSLSCPDLTIEDDDIVENTEDIQATATILAGMLAEVSPTMNEAVINILDNDVLEVAFQFPSFTMLESGNQMICLDVVGGSLDPDVMVSLTLTTTPGVSDASVTAATPNADYNPMLDPNALTFTFTSGNTLCTTLEILEDTIDEPDEGLTVTATPASNQIQISGPSSVSVIIADNDVIAVRFTEQVFEVNEAGPAVQICMELFEGFVGPAGASIMIVNNGGTAEEGDDFVAISQTITFPPGATSLGDPLPQQCFFFSPLDDPNVEFTETIQLQASSTNTDVQFTGLGGNMATVNILDDDFVPITITQPPPFVVDEDGGPAMACVMISGVVTLERPITIQLMTQDGTADGAAPGIQADYCTIDEDITILPGQENMEFCREVLINDDDLCEGPETFDIVAASVPDGGAMAVNSPQTITINDNDVAEISANDISIPENIGMALVPVLLSGQKGPGRSCEVIATTMDGTAVSIGLNPDYMPLVGGDILTFDSDTTFIQLELEINDDGICEGMEQFQVMLSTSSPGCMIADDSSSITVTIEDDEIGGGGDDPHFSIVLPSGKLLCYTVQGEHGFSFNLISNKKMTMNARFVPDSRRSEVTWMGSMGIIVHDNTYKQSNATALRFEALEKKFYIGDKVELEAKNIEKLIFKNGKLSISEAPPTDHFRYPSIFVDLQDVEITFTMKFMREHLDIFWHRTGGKLPDSHGLIGQFFRKGVEIDEVRKILIMPNKEPVPVMRRPVWSFMEREKSKAEEEQLCWTAMNPGYQGEGLIDGTYFDYLVDSVMTSEFLYKKAQ